MRKSIWTIVTMGALAMLLVTFAMMLSLGQFQETPSKDWVKLSEQLSTEFKAKNVAVRVAMPPGTLRISYLAGIHSNYNLEVQNAEMKQVADYALKNYKGKDMRYVTEIRVNRTEIHGSGCFQTTYEGSFTLPVPRRAIGGPMPSDAPPPPPREN